MAPPPSPTPKDAADILDAIARRLQTDPGFALEMAQRMGKPERVAITKPDDLDLFEPGEPDFGEVDVLLGDKSITVTAQTEHVDQNEIHVSVLDRHLILCVGEGPDEKRHDVMLPAEVDEDRAAATFRNGVLDVVLPLRFPSSA